MRGQAIAAPTDTLYGLLADAGSDSAVQSVFRIKGRPRTKPILLLVESMDMAERLAARFPPGFEILAQAFWPGPLTMVVSAAEGVHPVVTAGLSTVAIRLPDSPVVTAIAKCAGRPLTGTSANRSGRPGARSADEVQAQLGDRIPLILDGGPVAEPVPSTILALVGGEPRILREGAVAAREIERVLRRSL